MKWGMILLLVFLGIGLTGSAQADELNYWEANIQVGSTNFLPFEIPCPTDQNLPPLAEQCQREFVIFDIKHDPADQIGLSWSPATLTTATTTRRRETADSGTSRGRTRCL